MPINRVLKRIPGPVLGTRFGGFCEWYLRFGCPKHDLADAQDRPDSVCLSVVCNTFFAALFSMIFVKNSFAISEKVHSKKGVQGGIRRRT